MSRYLFFVNQLYSYSILRPLQAAIWARGEEVKWFFHGCSNEYLSAAEQQCTTVEQVKEFNPVAIFAPGNWIPDFFPGLKVQVFHGLAINKRGDDEAANDHYNIRGFFDLYCTHGEEDTARFSELAEQHRHFGVRKTGWPKLDPLFQENADAGSRERINTQKPIVFYASTFTKSVTSTTHLYETIKALVEKGHYHWLVTLHPKMEPNTVAMFRALSGPDFTFFESNEDILPLIKLADVMVCDTSSIMFEFIMLGKPLVTFRTRMPGPYLINIDSALELEPAIAHALTKPELLLGAARAYARQLHEFSDGQSSERILDAVADFAKQDVPRLKPKPLNLVRKLKARKKMKYYHLR